MSASEKVLWAVHYKKLDEFVAKAIDVKVTAVAIRTDNDLAKAIPVFHSKGVKVFGWRWPSSKRDVALNEANKVVALFTQGLDGYFVDPEGDKGKSWDWDLPGLEPLADEFCRVITTAAGGKPFGMTSHYRARNLFPHIPWKVFFQYATVLLPQAYWRSTQGQIGYGLPAENYVTSIWEWHEAGADKAKIVPMAGELGVATAAEIREYVAQALAEGIGQRHFYTYDETVKNEVWNSIALA